MVGPLLPDGPIGPAAGLGDGAAPPLSDRERAILDCLVRGDANKEIGRRFGVSEASVKRQVRALLQKLGVTNRTQAAVWALEHNVGR
jgi:two-component system nitrate/nitrite response regulator NarL